MQTHNLIAQLGHIIHATLLPLLPDTDEKIALVDFPNHANVGDSAIWLGEQYFFQQSRFRDNIYTCDIETYSKESLRAAIGNGTILLHGGGNLGDLWPKRQNFREQIIHDFLGNRIIQLPQSICFRNRANLLRTRNVFERHPDLTLLVRDRSSLKIATNELHTRASLCPDMAFYLGAINMPIEATIPCVWLYRRDKEGRTDINRPDHPGVWPYDWNRDKHTDLVSMDTVLRYQYGTGTGDNESIRRELSKLYTQLSNERVVRGCSVLARAHTVITERLHGHILCLLMGIPHYILDTPYGKTRNFVDTWGYRNPLVNWCDSGKQALSAIDACTPLMSGGTDRKRTIAE